MKINKSLNIDLNIISPQKHIRIHEGDIDSVDILIGVTVDDESVGLDGVTIKYDATINNYLAEQDANGSVVDDKISIPVTQNMTAMSGLLLIDVRMIQNDQILFTQTICATVEKAVVNGSTYIDFDKVTIIQRMNALEDKMDYIEELVENFDTSKLIVSTNRPPMGAPVEVDVDLLRVGDTWILSGDNIVYKLVEAQYNYQPVPSAEPYHKFTWQPLNERYGVGNTEPPTTKTYQPIVYTINEVQWSWLPVPEYFKGDHYLMQIGVGEPPTYYICKSGTMASTGVCTYTWREDGGGASSGITIINTETVPESAEWGDSIPASYAGNTGKAGELAYWEEDGYFWGLFSLATDPITGNISYNWLRQADEIDISDLKASIATKMKFAPIQPTAAQIAAMPSGQLYGDTVNHKGIIKGGQSFYDTDYIDGHMPTSDSISNGYLINGFALESGIVDASGEEVENNKAMRMTEMIPYARVISCDFLSRTGNLYIAYYDSEGNFATRHGYTPTQTAVLSSNYPYFRMCFYEAVVPSRTETEFKSWVTLKIKTAIKSELDEKADKADVTAALNTKADLAETSAALAGKLDVPINKLGAVTPNITEIDKLCNLNTLAERESPGSAYSRFSIQGGNLYLVSGKAASNVELYCLGGFLDSENNVLAKFGTEPYMIYNDFPVIAPEWATALIVNTNKNSTNPISCYNAEYDTDCIDEIKSALESIPTKVSDLPNDIGYITERDIDGKANAPIIKGEAITADSTVSGKIYRFDNGTEYITETGMYSDYTVQGGKLYLISGKAGQSASMYCLGGFFDSQNNLLKTFGTDSKSGGKVYTDYAVTAPDNAVKVIVNTWTPNPIACYNAEYDADCLVEIKGTIARLSRDYSLDVADALIRQAKKNPFQLAALDKGYVTFVFDDLMSEIDSIASIFEQYQMPLCLAAIPVKMSQRANWLEQSRGSFTPNMLKSEIMRVVVSNGGEILAHNISPVVNVTNQYDYDFMYGYFVKCKKAIEDAGFKVRGIIKAGGTGAISGTPEIERWLIGNYEYSNIGSAENYNKTRIDINQPLNDLKAAIQDAYTNHTWLRIAGHGYGAEHLGDYLPDEAALEAILDYCNTLGITVCTYAYIFDNFSSSAFLESLKGNQ